MAHVLHCSAIRQADQRRDHGSYDAMHRVQGIGRGDGAPANAEFDCAGDVKSGVTISTWYAYDVDTLPRQQDIARC